MCTVPDIFTLHLLYIYTNQTRNPKKQDKKSWRICYHAFSPSLPLKDLPFSQSHIPNESPICLLCYRNVLACTYLTVKYLTHRFVWILTQIFLPRSIVTFCFYQIMNEINIVHSNGSAFCLHNGWLPTLLFRYI